MLMSEPRETLRFGDCELDVAAYELRRDGRPVRLERQPMDLLIMLVERRGLLVTRADIIERLWGKDVFVDVETGVHTAVRKIRQALRDSPEHPSFVETVSGKGYRFIASVQVVGAQPDDSQPAAPPDPTPAPLPEPAAAPVPVASDAVRSGGNRLTAARAGIGLLAMAAAIAWAAFGVERVPSAVRIAVLPFENLSGDPGRDYLADGLTEETIASLGQVDSDRLSVVGRTTVMSYQGAARSVAEIGRELDADYLLESSIRAEGDLLRITAKLIRARDQVQVWSQTYNREPTSMLGLQQELSAAIAEQIRFRLSAASVDALARRETKNPAAYDLYLRGLNFANQRTPATTDKAIEHFRQATQLDPDYALAWSGLAEAYTGSLLNSDFPPLEVTSEALDAAARAVRADAALSEAQFVSGYANWILTWNWRAAETELRRAVDLDPRNVRAHTVLGHVLSQMGRHAEALASMRRARELDPLSAQAYAMSSQVAFQARDYPAALDFASQAIALSPEFWIGHIMRGQALAEVEQHEAALDALAIANRFSGGNSKAVSLQGYVLGRAGRRQEAQQVLDTLEALARQRFVPPYAMALVHAGLGEREFVFAWLERAFAAHDTHLMYLTVDSKWDRYRNDARFEALLARCGFAATIAR
jgi:TolB-like protein/DNA-binding winged helix-turn-helix (wHTH) protein/Flp pilus assembly protein TadD